VVLNVCIGYGFKILFDDIIISILVLLHFILCTMCVCP